MTRNGGSAAAGVVVGSNAIERSDEEWFAKLLMRIGASLQDGQLREGEDGSRC